MNKKLQKYKNSNISQKIETNQPYEIINELLAGLNNNLKESLKYLDKSNVNLAKEKAKKAQSIAYALQTCLDAKHGGDIAYNLNYLYRHIRFATKNFIEKDKSDLLTSAYFVSSEIFEGWKGMNSSVA